MRTNSYAHLALLTVSAIYGANYIIAKGLMPGVIGPSGFIVIRAGAGAFMFAVLAGSFSREKVNREDWLRFFLCGLFGVATNQLLFFNGLNLTSPVNASIIMTLTPVLVLLLSLLLKTETFLPLRGVGMLLGLGGALWLILHQNNTSLVTARPLGDFMILLNATSYALYLILVKPLMRKYHPITVISRVFLIGFALVLPVGWKQFGAVEWNHLIWDQWLGIAYVVLGTTFLAYLLNIFAIKYVTPTVVSGYIYLQPLLAVIFAAIYAAGWSGAVNYNQAIDGTIIACAACIFIGVFLVSRPAH